MKVQWYPGHMTKAMRMMQENIKLIDLVIEVLDARAPLSSRNPDIDSLAKNRARLLILNKADLADKETTAAFKAAFEKRGFTVLSLDARKSGTVKALQASIEKACEKKILQNQKKGILNRPLRAMVTGIPNVGKSTLINTLAGKASAKTGNKPGVTKGKQWIRLNAQVELLDTPGVLWPKFEDERVGERLALLGTINDDIIDRRELALSLLRVLLSGNPQILSERYGIMTDGTDLSDEKALYEILCEIARKRGALLKGGELDPDKAASALLDDFRAGRLGALTLDAPEEL
ncbi:MAG: ribosome biogenesis GTPase YlqF [Lachnospiraceae bacterium]|nr:ribosome biogenesis GTPase YlqF [Lachnospiraceae bacterium]